MADRMTKHCKYCSTVYTAPRRQGRPPQFCSEDCRSEFKRQYHASYDATPEQLQRRREYMRSVREAQG